MYDFFCTLFLVMPLNNMQKQTTFIFEQTTKFNQKLYNFIHIFTYKFLYFLYFFFVFNILLFRLIFDFGLFVFCFCCWVFFVFCFGKFFLLLLFFYACVFVWRKYLQKVSCACKTSFKSRMLFCFSFIVKQNSCSVFILKEILSAVISFDILVKYKNNF